MGIYLSTKISVDKINKVADISGIRFINPETLETAGKAKVMALNKTGTITKGVPSVTDVFTADHFSSSGYSVGGLSEDELLEAAALLESNNDSPISKAIIKYTDELIIESELELSYFKTFPGKGIEGECGGITYRGGCLEFVMEKAVISEEIKLRATELAAVGKTPIFYSKGKRLLGIIAISDEVKEEVTGAISELKKQGIHVAMLTGGIELTSTIIGTQAGVDGIISGESYEGKALAVKELSQKGSVIVASENKNDEPSLRAADVGVYMGTDYEDTEKFADVVISKAFIHNLTGMVRLSRILIMNIHENFGFLVVYCLAGIVLASGVFYKAFGLYLNPVISFLLMLFSVLIVALNARRLHIYDLNDSSKDKPSK